MQEGIYEVRNGGLLVAYARITERSYYITPVKLSGDALNKVVSGLQEGVLPDGYTLNAKKGRSPGDNPSKPNWPERTTNRAKREQWQRRKAKT
jgi:hypothetical protein